MPTDTKIRTEHLRRQAVVYVRRSTPRRVRGNREGTVGQSALTDRARTATRPLTDRPACVRDAYPAYITWMLQP